MIHNASDEYLPLHPVTVLVKCINQSYEIVNIQLLLPVCQRECKCTV